MTLEEVEQRVQRIRDAAPDDERAHALEDALYIEIVRHHAANGCPLAREALKTADIKFARWCA